MYFKENFKRNNKIPKRKKRFSVFNKLLRTFDIVGTIKYINHGNPTRTL